jgi:DNA-binding transcriptional MerR regulator
MVIKTIKKMYSDYKEDDAANEAIADAIQEKRDKAEKEIVEKNKKDKENFRKAQIEKKYAAAERIRGNSKSPTEAITSTEESSDITSTEGSFKKGGRVKKAKGGLIKGFPKIAKKGY